MKSLNKTVNNFMFYNKTDLNETNTIKISQKHKEVD